MMDGMGATIMGRNMFGPIRGEWEDSDWKGWWGGVPPYHCPVFVLTHYPHQTIEMAGGTTFHFVTDGIESAYAQAQAAAGAVEVDHLARIDPVWIGNLFAVQAPHLRPAPRMLQEASGNAPKGVAAHDLVLVGRIRQELATCRSGCGVGRRCGGGGSAGKREQQAGCAKLFHGFSGRYGVAKQRFFTGRKVSDRKA